jgi:hypothetical protein
MAMLYRFLTGDDDSAFCHKVSAALAEGWTLQGGPAFAYDSGRGVMRCGQAVLKVTNAPYDPEGRLRDA